MPASNKHLAHLVPRSGRTIKAAVSTGRGSFEIMDIEVHDPGAGEVQVAIHASGVCHTDWDMLALGRRQVLGHEGAGVVTAVGPGVTRASIGDSVVLNWAIPCGKCQRCREGRRNICLNNSPVTGSNDGGHAHPEATTVGDEPLRRSFSLGTLSEATVVREEAVVVLPPGIPMQAAALLGCGVMTGYGSAVNTASVKPGESVAVIGCGGVGLNVIQGCRISGATPIVAIDVDVGRLDRARQFGASHVILSDPDDQDLVGAAEELTKLIGAPADVSFECTAKPALAAAPLALIRNGGRAIQVSGIEQRVDFDCRLFEWDKTYINPLYGQCDPDRDFPAMFDLYLSGELLLDELITATWDLNDLEGAFDELLAGRGAKNVVVLGQAS